MPKLILALTVLLTSLFAAHDVLAGSGSPFAGFYQSKQAGCVIRVHVGNDFEGQWITTRSESNNESIPQCDTGLVEFTEKSTCRTNRTGDLVCRPMDSSKKRQGEIVLRADGTMDRAEDSRFGGSYVKIGDAPTRREGKQ